MDERLNTVLANYQSILVASPYGWVANVVPNPKNNQIAYVFWFKFNDSNCVSSRWRDDTVLNSSYRLKALQQPELIFDTYTYLHKLADATPDDTYPGAVRGTGFKSDFELEIISGTADSFVLKGKYHGTDVTLFRASAKDTAGVLGYPLAGTYEAKSKWKIYKTTLKEGTVTDSGEYSGNKITKFESGSGIVSIDYTKYKDDLQYNISLKKSADKEIEVTLHNTLQTTFRVKSFKVLEASYDPATGNIYLKTLLTTSAGNEWLAEETFTRL
ncbi:DUF4302 domain-containing protein [Chitinophaga oryzae]|uniref:DUF4302 domain-containing protein n=1 Tax=Chitinophaga oryzae TaxID=2725414 RepID=A0AAE6ZGI0_9BACT|nr:DUF4302 domain-containing protein [Chitinophaga oryzae]QJB32573.1 DUF4302 domain-containing protein [Chitinophaga oryzae]